MRDALRKAWARMDLGDRLQQLRKRQTQKPLLWVSMGGRYVPEKSYITPAVHASFTASGLGRRSVQAGNSKTILRGWGQFLQ